MIQTKSLRLSIGVFLVALSTLILEVILTRVFEVIYTARIGYAIITCAMFAFGISGCYGAIWPLKNKDLLGKRIVQLLSIIVISVLLLRPALNLVHHLYVESGQGISSQVIVGISIYALLIIPFFLSGLILTYIFTAHSRDIQKLYFWDLCGAGLGCVIFLPIFSRIGPGGIMFLVAAIFSLAVVFFAKPFKWKALACVAALVLTTIPFSKTGYFDFTVVHDKRSVRSATEKGNIEVTRWDPMSKIDVIPITARKKHIAYDGGSQSSHFFKFDGDFASLREKLLSDKNSISHHFWHPGVMASHYLKRDSGSEVIILGSAGGQETKAALLFNPKSVDGIEMVSAVVDLGKGEYSDFIGNIFLDSRVNNSTGEGRSWLRKTDRKFDIIQIHSNHTTSHIASGIASASPIYLQTVEAYQEYFSHLREDGILHINHHYYPRLVTTAAKAWKDLGRRDFQKHLLLYENKNQSTGDRLPTMLIKMSPWSAKEVEQLDRLFSIYRSRRFNIVKVMDPIQPAGNFLSDDFLSGDFPKELQSDMDYLVFPITDNRPYFSSIQKGLSPVEENAEKFTNKAMAYSLNKRLEMPLGEYTFPAAIGLIGLIFSFMLIVLPLKFSEAGRIQWEGKFQSLIYFASLGSGFIFLQIMLIQMFIRLIGYPLYTYIAVLCSMLVSAGIGSMAANKLKITPRHRWNIPFVGILAAGILLLISHAHLIDLFLEISLTSRVAAAALMIFPLGFFLGMPFPLGILWLSDHPEGSIAWAWGMNGLFTVFGGLSTGLVSIWIGFDATFMIGLGIYCLAFFVMHNLRSENIDPKFSRGGV